MLLAVAGLKDDEVKARVKVLAGEDWSSFPAYERQALRFSAKLSRTPGEVKPTDVADLVTTFGPERTADIIWYIGWCNYMTRIADAFQLPLEKENPFSAPPPAPKNEPG
ncbi:MAG: deiodinase family protein, partial [Gemmataceae bacterium]